MFSRKFIMLRMLGGLIMLLMFGASPAKAQFTINFDEYGNGTIQVGGGVIPLQSLGNITDPFDPGSGIKPLGYNIVGSLGVVPTNGDINLFEPQAPTGTVSDLLRWTQGFLLVYSELPETGEVNPPPADVGLPLLRQNNTISMLETGPESGPNGMFGYVPAPGGPGEISAPTTYNFISDYLVPEPASVALIGLAASLILLRRRR